MDLPNNNSHPIGSSEASELSAWEMSPLELNNIPLDVNHTVLTPELLESIKAKMEKTSPEESKI